MYIQLIVVGEQFNHLTPIGGVFLITSKINFNFFFGIFNLVFFSKKTMIMRFYKFYKDPSLGGGTPEEKKKLKCVM